MSEIAYNGNVPENFVLVTDIVPDVIIDARYFGTFNFVGDPIEGYEEPVMILTKEAAEALKEVSDELKEQGLRIKLFDCYRPTRAVDQFRRWSEIEGDERMKSYFYPNMEKNTLFDQGFIVLKSSHTRGSTMDMTLFDMKTQQDLDMGTTFDYFGYESYAEHTEGLTKEQIANRRLLRDAMLSHGFKPMVEEWWHFTLANEPYPDTYFNFPVKAASVKRNK